MKKVLSFLLAFLLAGSVILFSLCLIGWHVVSPAAREGGAAVSESVLRAEEEQIHERVTELSRIYGFTPERVNELITVDTLRELNAQASLWWSSIVRNGALTDEIIWNADGLEEVLEEDPLLTQGRNRDEEESVALAAAREIRETVVRAVLPMRHKIIAIGLQWVNKRIDVVNVTAFLLGTPWAMLGVCAVLAGLIALLWVRNLRGCLVWIGSALGAAGIVMIALAALFLSAGIGGMIREASASLAVQYRSVVTESMICAAVLTALLLGGCAVCFRRGKGEKA